jgi:hypothetical protein
MGWRREGIVEVGVPFKRNMDDLYVNGDLDFTYLSHELVRSHVQGYCSR